MRPVNRWMINRLARVQGIRRRAAPPARLPPAAAGGGVALPDAETEVRDDADLDHEDPFSVILYNDNVNSMDYVISCLISVFGHPYPLAAKIMMEAHYTGRALAATEGRPDAERHCRQLKACGLNATIESAS